MSLIYKSPIRIAVLAAALGLTAFCPAQQAIRVEESTGTTARPPDAHMIDIQIGAPAEQRERIQVTDIGSTAPIETGASRINLTPAEFRSQPTKEPSANPSGSDAGTTMPTPVPITAIEAPSGMPVPTNLSAPVEDKQAPAEPAGEQGATPSVPEPVKADDTTTAPIEGSILSTSESEEPAGFNAAEIFPSATLAKENVIQRGGVRIPTDPESLSSAPLAITVPDVFGTTLTNGLRFFHFESRDLPRVRVTLLIEAGKNEDPSDKVGLAEVTARTMRAGGAAGKSGDEIDRQLEQIGSDLEFVVERDHVAGSLFALTEKAPEAMALLADILTKPDFDEAKFEQQLDRAREELRRQNDEPDEISRREFRKIIYGSEHPLARTPTSASISSISRDDVRAFHDARYRPSTVWVGVSGDISLDDARKLVEGAFGNWNRPVAEPAAEITFNADTDTTSGVFLSQKATAQSQIRLGHTGIPRQHPQVYAVNVLNSIYGTGGFSSRLMNQVRTKHGYVYGVGGGIFSDEPVGLFLAGAASKAATTGAAIKEIISVTRGLTETPVNEAELETARRDVIFTFVNQFDTPSETIATYMLHAYRGYPEDYLKTFTDKIRAVTANDLKKAAYDLLRPDQLKIYVIGNEAELDQPMGTFGPVQNWELEDLSAAKP